MSLWLAAVTHEHIVHQAFFEYGGVWRVKDPMTAEVASLPSAAEAAGDGCAVILAVGGGGAQSAALMNGAIGCDLPETESRTGAPDAALVASAARDAKAVVLCVGALDSRDRSAAAAANNALVAGLGVAGAVVLAVRLADVARPVASGVEALFGALERNLRMRAGGKARNAPSRRLLVVAVRDYEAEEADEKELCDCVIEMLEARFARVAKPPMNAEAKLGDLFDVRVLLFASAVRAAREHELGLEELGDILGGCGAERYVDKRITGGAIVATVGAIGASLAGESKAESAGRGMPGDAELAATHACDGALQRSLSRFRSSLRQWQAAVDSGRIVGNYGSETAGVIAKTLSLYADDCGSYANSGAYERKLSELRTVMYIEANVLFKEQLGRLSEVAQQYFRGQLGRVRVNTQVESKVQEVVRESEKYFIDKATLLVCANSGWRFEHERSVLVGRFRDDATERLQLARLQGNYMPSLRAPIAFVFHTLLTAPFGRDSGSMHPHADEMNVKFDPDKIKKAELLRSRPYPTQHSIRLGRGRAMPGDALDVLDDLFAEE